MADRQTDRQTEAVICKGSALYYFGFYSRNFCTRLHWYWPEAYSIIPTNEFESYYLEAGCPICMSYCLGRLNANDLGLADEIEVSMTC